MPDPVPILLVANKSATARAWDSRLRTQSGARLDPAVVSPPNFADSMTQRPWGGVVIQFPLSGTDVPAMIREARKTIPGVPVVIVAGRISAAAAVELMREGANDILLPERDADLGSILADLIAREENHTDRANIPSSHHADLLRALIEVVPAPAWILDPEGRPVAYNRRWHQWTGVRDHPPQSLVWHDAIHADDREVVMRAMDRWHAVDEAPVNFRLRRHDGSYSRCRLLVSTLSTGDGVDYRIGAGEDVEKLLLSQQKLQQSTDLLHAIFEGIPDPVFAKDIEGCYLLCNSAVAQAVGRPIEEIIGQDDHALFPRVDAEKLIARGRKVMESGQAETDLEHLIADGKPRVYLATKSPFRSSTGSIAGIIGISRDITSETEARHQSRQREAFARGVLDSVDAFIAVLDSDGTITSVNQAWSCLSEFRGPAGLPTFPTRIGENYIERLRVSDFDRAGELEAGIRGVMSGSADRFRCERKAEGAIRSHWFLVTVTPLQFHPGCVVISHRDITEQNLMAAKVAGSERRFRELANVIPQIVWTANADGALNQFNARALEYSGLTESSLAGWKWESVIHPEDRPKTMEVWSQALRSGLPSDIQARLLRHDGVYRWHIVRQVPIRDASGRVTEWYGTCTDVDDLLRVRDALRDEDQLVRTLVDSVPDLIHVRNRNGGIVLQNRAHAQYTGSSHSPSNGDCEERPGNLTALQQQVVTEGVPVLDHEEQLLSADGQSNWFLTTMAPVRDHTGTLIGVVSVSHKIQARKEYERELTEGRDRLSLALSSARLGIWDWDLTTGRVVRSPACLTLLGNPQLEENYSAFINAVHPDDRDRLRQSISTLTPESPGFDLEFRIIHPDGQVREIHETGRGYFDEDGRVSRVIGVLHDVTDRNRIRMAVQASEARLRQFLEFAPASIAMFDREMRYVYVSKRWRSDYGLGDADLTGKCHYDVFPEIPDRWRAIHARCLGGAVEKADGEEFVRADGSIQWVRWEVYPWMEAPGQIGGIVIFTEDVTAQKEGQAEQRKLVRLIEHSADFIAIAGLDGRLQFLNPGGRRMIGIEADADLSQIRISDYVPAKWQEFFRDTVLKTVRDSGLWEGEMQLRNLKTGELIDVHRTAFLIPGESGSPGLYATVTRDITRSNRAERELRDRERLLSIVTDAARVGLVVVDQDYQYMFVNSAYAEIFGMKHDELVGGRIPDSLSGGWSQIQPRLEMALGGKPQSYELVLPDPDGADPRTFRVTHELRKSESGQASVVVVVVDISELKRADRSIRESELRYRRLVEVLPAALFLHRDDGIVFCNSAFVQLMGAASESELLGLSPFRVAHPDFHNDVRDRMASMQAGECPAPGIEMRIVRLDGSEVYAHSVSTILTQGESPTYLVALSDLTERERTADLLHSVLESVNDAIITINSQGTIQSTNSAVEKLFELRQSQMIGRNISEFMPEPHRSSHDGYILSYLTSGVAKIIGIGRELTALRKDGTEFPIELSVTEFRHENERRFTGVIRDISSRKLAENELHMRDRAIRAATQGLLITDPGKPDNPIVYASPGFERITGYTQEEVLGKNCRFLQGKDTDPTAVAQMRDAMKAKEPCTVEVLNYRKDGVPFWNELSISPVHDETGKVTQFVGVQVDVTARRRLETQLRQVQKMEAVGQLAGGVAHDFNNLLTIINGYSELLLESLAPTDHRHDIVEEIRRAGERSSALTRQLLAFSRQQVINPRVLDLNVVISDTAKMLRRLIGEDVQLVTTLDPNLWPVRCDAGQIEQVLMNLAVNARDAMPGGGKLTIETQNIDLDAESVTGQSVAAAGPYVMISMTDNGAGIPPEIQSRIFDPFFTTKGPGKGTGLGLATVYGVLKQNGGHIAVYSEFGLGTTFKVYLPRTEVNTNGGSHVTQKGLAIRGTETILLVEDEEGVRRLARTILTTHGYSVMEAEGGEQALTLVRDYPGRIDLLVTDVVMPGMGGRLVAEQVKALHPEVRVLFMSGYTDDAVVRHGILVEGVHFLQKPFSPNALVTKVRTVLDKTPAE